jgi:hypothetical protein
MCLNLSDSVHLGRPADKKNSGHPFGRGVYTAVSRPKKKELYCLASSSLATPLRRSLSFARRLPYPSLAAPLRGRSSCASGASALPRRRPAPFLCGILSGILDSKVGILDTGQAHLSSRRSFHAKPRRHARLSSERPMPRSPTATVARIPPPPHSPRLQTPDTALAQRRCEETDFAVESRHASANGDLAHIGLRAVATGSLGRRRCSDRQAAAREGGAPAASGRQHGKEELRRPACGSSTHDELCSGESKLELRLGKMQFLSRK